MVLDAATELEQIHTLVNRLDPQQIHAVGGLLETMVPALASASTEIPWEDEEISPKEQAALAEAREWLDHNEGIPMEEVLADFGLTMADLERMSETPSPFELDARK